ncbi:MAG: SprT family zinc-dependent metalloprotease [Gammaproteobacteria bacterium]
MNTNSQTITVSDIAVEIVRKNIKNIHLTVQPPEGNVRISVPRHVTHENVRLTIISKLNWIRRKQAAFRIQPRQTPRAYVTGEIHYYRGERYILEVKEKQGKHTLSITNSDKMLLTVSPGTSMQNRALVVNNWYRKQLKDIIPGLIDKWEPIIGRQVKDWGIKKMKTRWGSCNIRAHRIWLNLELAKTSPECLEYVLVHELVHLHERYHNENFKRLMDKYYPNWRQSRELLKSGVRSDFLLS